MSVVPWKRSSGVEQRRDGLEARCGESVSSIANRLFNDRSVDARLGIALAVIAAAATVATIAWSAPWLAAWIGGATMIAAVGVVTARLVRCQHSLEAALRHQAGHDTLTGLPNRAFVYDRLEQALLAARQNGTSLALMVMDLDRFKEVNNTLGHQCGDTLLRQVGDRLRRALPASDTVARLGGDEFALLLPTTDAATASRTAGALIFALDRPFKVEGQGLSVDASIGIALYPDHGDQADILLRRADVAMYEAKQAGSGYAVYDLDQDRHSPDRLALVGELRKAIERDELVLHYQPKIDFATGHVNGLEALVRWQHPRRGLLPPDQFIPLAERTGLIKPLSRWVLNAALRQARAWREDGLEIPVAVNLSMRNLHDSMPLDTIAELLATWGMPPACLKVEITESTIMADPARATETLTGLRHMGVQIDIDDFGTGYSSLGHLKRLPVDQIKIDRAFVGDMAVDPNDFAIVRSTIDLGHNLGLQVIAEGVEDRATWDLLAKLGCDSAQGYYFSPPLPAVELKRWLGESAWGVVTSPR